MHFCSRARREVPAADGGSADESVEVGTSNTTEQVEDVDVLGVVPVEGRGSLPFALLHGESLVAVASWALGEAEVELLDFDASWSSVQEREAVLAVHDPLCPATPVPFLREAVAAAARRHCVVVGVRPVTDTVKRAEGGVVGRTVDREGLVAVASPLVLPPAVCADLPAWPDLDDLAALVDRLRERYPVSFLEAPPLARRVADESDLRLLEGLAASGERYLRAASRCAARSTSSGKVIFRFVAGAGTARMTTSV